MQQFKFVFKDTDESTAFDKWKQFTQKAMPLFKSGDHKLKITFGDDNKTITVECVITEKNDIGFACHTAVDCFCSDVVIDGKSILTESPTDEQP